MRRNEASIASEAIEIQRFGSIAFGLHPRGEGIDFRQGTGWNLP